MAEAFGGTIDLHIHSTVSDGTDTPEEILRHVKEAGIRLFSLTDHDAVKGVEIIQENLPADGPLFITGVEFSCKDEEGKYHILGYAYDPGAESIRSLIGQGHRIRMEKVRARLAALLEEFGFDFPKKEKEALFALDNPGKPHFGNMLVRCGYALTKDEAIEKYINRLHCPTGYIRPEDAISGILAGGGIPVLAHPCFGSGRERIFGEDMDRRIRKLADYGLLGVEAFYSGFTDEMRCEMLSLARKYGLSVTAGSDYHGMNKTVRLGETGLSHMRELPPECVRFLEKVLPEGYTNVRNLQ